MASAMLVSRNESSKFLSPNHHQPPRTSANFMGKIPFLNPNPNPNFTPNNNHFSRKQLNHQNGDELPNPVTDDAASFNHHQKSNDGGGMSRYVHYDITRYSKMEIRSLKSRLISELDKVRSLTNQIETGELRNVSINNNGNHLPKKRPFPVQQPVKEVKRGKQQPQSHQQQPAYVASSQVMKMCAQVLSKVMKQKAGYVFNEPVDVVGMGLHDYNSIVKRPMDLGTIRKNMGTKLYRTPDEFAADVRLTFNNALMYNPKGHEVHSLAEKFLEKFEQCFRPVYHKFQLEKQQYLKQQKVETRPKEDMIVVVDEVQGTSWSKNPSPEPPRIRSPQKKPEPRPEPRLEPPPRPEPRQEPPPRPEPRQEPPLRSEPPPRLEPRLEPPLRPTPQPRFEPRLEPPSKPETPPRHVPAPEPVEERAHVPLQEVVRAGLVVAERRSKLPKPKAKDPNKREMNMEEKHKLGAGLQSLPEEKMSQVIQIIRKRNGDLTQDGDEIELDIEAVDTETLWELDRFVTNYKKMVSKQRRQALMDMPNGNVGHHDYSDQVGVSERVTETAKAVKRSGGGDVGDEDVDIGGDEVPVHNFPPVEIDKDDDRNHDGDTSSSSSSSSGSDSSSSSDSDSGSSSGSDSDVDDAQSRDNESKNIPH
ncbi:hypothetical protein SOVF_190690 [Spinacia oleracea]|uniref:Transcription factor GTE7 n=1 Tax=Spinacia oleracea TaxID=3562 RepID=A0A9R0JV98_SPIOL|nr:transcription factor GTE7-like [Spinacia oleracea]KNA05399.1 hypothetical protein SOVF_190690 [Spinacia oleracea]